MTTIREQVVSPSIATPLNRIVENLAGGADAVLVGPPGSGLSAVAEMATLALKDQGIRVIKLDCRTITPWQEAHRQACAAAGKIASNAELSPVLLLDHCGDLEVRDVMDLYQAATALEPFQFHARLWVGSFDCRCSEFEAGFPATRNPRSLFLMPDYHRDDLLRIYSVIGQKGECEWGEAILYFLHDWCGSDLSLVEGISTYLYGNWRERLYDDSVADCLERWLRDDPAVDEYRRYLRTLQGPRRDYVRLLCSGGKVPCRATAIEHETDSTLRALYFDGLIIQNLIPGFYQFRNLTVKLLAMQREATTGVAPASLLRRSTNSRAIAVLQDTEVSLRHLLGRCFSAKGLLDVKRRLSETKTDEMPISSELRRSLLGWAREAGSEGLQQKLLRHLTDYTKDFYSTRNLWSRVCRLHTELDENPRELQDPPLEKVAEYLTFNELGDLILNLCPEVFPNWGKETSGRQPPAKRWPTYLARLRRLRNQSAHLRNITFQDMEDLLSTSEEMRRDMIEYITHG